MVLLEGGAAAAAAASTGTTLFDYNRKNFMYDRKLRQETEFAIMEFRIKQAELWREDVRDIIGLTSVKMDTYLIVTAVQLGFCVMAFCEGRLASGTPEWLIGSHCLALVSSFLYFLMSVWLAMHASISAKSYEVRLLTQLVRLPVPSWTQIEGTRTYASQFEQMHGRQMFRVPFAQGQQESIMDSTQARRRDTAGAAAGTSRGQAPADGSPRGATPATPEAADPWGLERNGTTIPELDSKQRADPRQLRHVQIVNDVVQYWQAYDGFARVSMSMGTNQLVTGLAYYVLGYVLISNHSPVAAWSAILLFLAVKMALIRLDMSLTAGEFALAFFLVAAGPVLTAIATHQWARHTEEGEKVAKVLAPIAYFTTAGWLLYLLYISRVVKQPGGAMLPTRFRSVLYLDVFGWIKRKPTPAPVLNTGSHAGLHTPSPSMPPPAPTPGEGPALQVQRIEHGIPLPMRPEDLPSSQRPARSIGEAKEHSDPASFVPKPKGWNKKREAEQVHFNPGMAPWKIFWWATSLLACLWIGSGIITFLQSLGCTFMEVHPLLREEFIGGLEGIEAANAAEGGEGPEGGRNALLQRRPLQPGSARRWWWHTSLVQASLPMLHGKALPTNWPHVNARPLGLACEGGMAAVATRFGIFSTALEANATSVQFLATPQCSNLVGEGLQDLSLVCGNASAAAQPGSCKAMVMHRQGTRVTPCSLASSGVKTKEESVLVEESALLQSGLSGRASMEIGVEWLDEHGPTEDNQAHEEVASAAFRAHCEGDEACLYLETSHGRIVELRQSSVEEGQQWLPRHVLHKEDAAKKLPHGALHTFRDRYIVILRGIPHGSEERQVIEVLDPRRSSGVVLARWQLPRDQAWGAMCATANSLYMLPNGPSPQLWQFPVPAQFDVEVQPKPARQTEESPDSHQAFSMLQAQPSELREGSRLRRSHRHTRLQVDTAPRPTPW